MMYTLCCWNDNIDSNIIKLYKLCVGGCPGQNENSTTLLTVKVYTNKVPINTRKKIEN